MRMPKKLIDKDALAFAERLNASAKKADRLEHINAWMSRLLHVKRPTATAYIYGKHRPTFDKVQLLARELDVDAEWLYTGRGLAPDWWRGTKPAVAVEKTEPARTAPKQRGVSSREAVGALSWISAVLVGHVLSVSRQGEADALIAQLDAAPEEYRNTPPGEALAAALSTAKELIRRRRMRRSNQT